MDIKTTRLARWTLCASPRVLQHPLELSLHQDLEETSLATPEAHFPVLKSAGLVPYPRRMLSFHLPPPYICSRSATPSWIVEAAWTRRSKGKNGTSKNKKSWKQRTEKFFKPFVLDVFISFKYVHAKVMHRLTSSVVSVATTNAKDLRLSLPSLVDKNACKVIGQLIAERSLAADVYAVTFDLRKNEKLEGKLAIVTDSAIEHGLTLV